jgi:predicted dehydrogenase
MRQLSWGVLSTARIGIEKVIPPMLNSNYCRIDAIASRSLDTARRVAAKFGIPKAYGSYEELLADREIEAVYNPMPNHLHVPWTIQAAEAGKHVLCEKPIAITAQEAEQLIAVRDRTGFYIQEAFMVRTSPQWLKLRELVGSGRIGRLQAIQAAFSYRLTDPDNIRNKADIGGGGLLDIGCYPITTSRFVTGAEPSRVAAVIERDPVFATDRLGSVLMDFPTVQASFVYGTQTVAYQKVQFFGTEGRIELQIPFNAPPDQPSKIFLDDGSSLAGAGIEVIEIPACDQYGVAGDAFSEAIQNGAEQPVPLEDTIKNMRVIDAVFRAAETGQWEVP